MQDFRQRAGTSRRVSLLLLVGPSLWAAVMIPATVTAAAAQQEPYSRFYPERRNASSAGGGVSKSAPQQDDANLHAIRFVGRFVGYAVGDHGVIWKTEDGGQSWRLLRSPVHCPLRSLCFLTDKIGWIAGGGIHPHTRRPYGVVLQTEDGGENWRTTFTLQPADARSRGGRLEQDMRGRRRRRPAALPLLVSIRFFGLHQGVAVGEASEEVPSGVLMTADGGKTWRAVPGGRHPGWRAADFLNPHSGALAGRFGRLSSLGGGRLLKPAIDDPGLRSVHQLVLNRDTSGWLVGDGGLLLKTENAGLVWKSPPGRLPVAVRDLFDFRAVAARGNFVWVAGSPGSVIWHSRDGGKTWSRQFTGQTVPLAALHFADERHGWAAGALGLILHTSDGGQTWQAQRGGGRRAAYLALHTRRQSLSFPLLVKLSGEEGYRGTVLVSVRDDYGPGGPLDRPDDIRLSEAVTSAGASAGIWQWRFPLAIPGLQHNAEELWHDWNRRTEGRLQEVLVGSFVAQLRLWRPSVVLLDAAPPDDAAARFTHRAMVQAIRRAADPTAFVRQAQLAGLQPWRVSRVYVRLADGSGGDVLLSPHEYLPALRTVAHVAAAQAEAKLQPPHFPTGRRQAWRLLRDHQPGPAGATGGFFRGLPLGPGTAARRRRALFDEADAEQQRLLARRQRDFQAIAERSLDDPRTSAQMIAQLDRVIAGMDAERAALQLLHLAEEYRRRSQWESAEAAWIELISRFPLTQSAPTAMQQLFPLWAGAEPAWQRVQQVAVRHQRQAVNPAAVQYRLQQAARLLGPPLSAAVDGKDEDREESAVRPARFLSTSDAGAAFRSGQLRARGVRHWQQQALRLADLIFRRDVALYRSPEVQFPLAALLRARGAGRAAQRVYQQILQRGPDKAWKQTAEAELWLLAPNGEPPKTMGLCRRAEKRPTLDGVLSDACWEKADVFWLSPSRESDSALRQRAFLLLSYDADYLYVAARVPKVLALPAAAVNSGPRRRDADVARFDRIEIRLDVDRDYATSFLFAVDQRGWTAETCRNDKTWNPKWYVAADADEKTWRFEAAIPLRELLPQRLHRGTVWNVGLMRVVPARGVQTWTPSRRYPPRPSSFGLLRFD